PRGPEPSDIKIAEISVLRDTPDCLVAHVELDLTAWRGDSSIGTTVNVLYPKGDRWRFATNWTDPNDMWEQDCTADRSDELP
ncbi:MAG TPA: hypothetical protein VHL52_13510, partial [Acidimicrobiia bacterium]|nr:hypothetical protein [Acidimicrobiia bacterium]